MSEIFDSNTLPERRLNVRKIVALHEHKDVGDFLLSVKRDMAMYLATKILEGDSFFGKSAKTVGGYAVVEYGADCIVLTTDEYANLKREAFDIGVKHAQGYTQVPRFQSY